MPVNIMIIECGVHARYSRRQSHDADLDHHLNRGDDLRLRRRESIDKRRHIKLHAGQQSRSAALRGLRGNLANDGSALYRYDQANRMIRTTLSRATTLFNYNGDGVRLKQIINGAVTTYTQDIAALLPVVLQAKTGTVATQYLYSMGTRPIA